ncbi:MAG TPA: hypothetical protein VKX41_06180 [Alloacidobacterium sp.]|nr:hypothetical protein [Alloacidobacterium sp.]
MPPPCWRVLQASLLLAAGFSLPLSGIAAVETDSPSVVAAIFDGGPVTSTRNSIETRAIEAQWSVSAGKLSGVAITDKLHQKTLTLTSPFSLEMADGRVVRAKDLHFLAPPNIQTLSGEPGASRFSDRIGGKEVKAVFSDDTGEIRVDWSLIMRDGSQYVRQILTISAPRKDLAIRNVRLIDVETVGAKVEGSVAGSPIVAGDLFFGVEHPLSVSKVDAEHASADVRRTLPLPLRHSVTYSSVIGVAPSGQMRRAFLNYIERERAHPYRTFLHYNSWYDIGYFNQYNEKMALDVINSFGKQLHDQRGVTLDSFLFDDGWDNHSAPLWGFNSGFPNGFTPLREAAARYGTAPGVWISPFGGYGEPKKERLAAGKAEGFETVGSGSDLDSGFALSGPKYYARFHQICVNFLNKYGVNQFKFDGFGNANTVIPGSQFDSDFDAMVHLISDLRQIKPDVFIDLTFGTDPSPFWLLYGDAVHRGGKGTTFTGRGEFGGDTNFFGDGDYVEQWLTFRDGSTYVGVHLRGPLFPLNSVMMTGLVFARQRPHLNEDPGHDWPNEVHSFFGNGTQLQEMYVTPSLLTSADWDVLAEAAKWSRAHADILKDTHWIGGDPGKLQVYGWASWAPRGGILVLRNPSRKSQEIAIDVEKAFELPPGAARKFTAHSPWSSDASQPPITLEAGKPHTFKLAPFQVITLDADPQS